MKQPKKLLVLGGSPFQVPLIEKAKEMGLYVITCDYLPENPGHALADEYHNASTTDKEAILALAHKLEIDAITTFCSDPAVPTVGYVAGQLGLPGPSLASVEQLTEKDKFRNLMQKVRLNVPACFTVKAGELPKGIDPTQRYIVKPVDSSGSKGITQSTGEAEPLTQAINYALQFSRAGRCIIEGFIDGKQVHGDAFVKDGKLIYHYLGDHYFFTDTNSFIPISTRWPASISDSAMQSVVTQTEKLVQAAGYLDGPINIEARIGSDDKAYIIEIGPRNGGNFVPIIQQRLSGFDFTKAVIDIALGLNYTESIKDKYMAGAHYILHSARDGILKSIGVPEELKKHLFYAQYFKKEGDLIAKYQGSGQSLGVCLFNFNSSKLRDDLMNEYLPIVEIR
ncbi:ATP-grasp domain-containing protein [Vreelandella sp. H-I2]